MLTDEQVSAVTREGFDDLLETLLLQAEVLELRADDKVNERTNEQTKRRTVLGTFLGTFFG